MLDNDNNNVDDIYLINKKKNAKRKKVFNLIKKTCFLIGIILGFILIVFLYFNNDCSNVYHISVEGNIYLKDEDIIEIAKVNDDDKYLLIIPQIIENNLLKSPYIEEAKVYKLDNNLIKIEVKEIKQIAYLYEDYESKILLINNERILLDEDNYYLIDRLPLMEGYTKEQIEIILRGFKQIDDSTINEISEIHRYPFSYDENMLEIIMKDGNYCFVSWTGLKMLEEYYRFVSSIDKDDGNVCIYLDELTNSGSIRSCPWNE